MHKRRGKNPFVQSFGRLCAHGKQLASLSGPDLNSRINGVQQISDPPCLPIFKQGGGGSGDRGRNSPTVQMSTIGSTAVETIPDSPPPRLSTFKRRGGGGSEIP
jgi:hypothetical protein